MEKKSEGCSTCSAYGDKPQECGIFPDCTDCSGNMDEKDILLKDLCFRLPYGLKCEVNGQVREMTGILVDDKTIQFDFLNYDVSEVKPYLRLLDSMTEEENSECGYFYTNFGFMDAASAPIFVIWLLEHHFDFCGLIEKGLALEAPKDMYK